MTAAETGTNPDIDEGAVVGYRHDPDAEPARIGDDARIRRNTTIYTDVTIGDRLSTGHGVLIREHTTVGDDATIGTGVTIENDCSLGSSVSLQTRAYVPTNTAIADRVFVGPGAVLTNDPAPTRKDVELLGPTLEADVSIGANATVLPGVTVGAGAFVAAGAVVTHDVAPETLAIGTPAKRRPLPPDLEGGNG